MEFIRAGFSKILSKPFGSWWRWTILRASPVVATAGTNPLHHKKEDWFCLLHFLSSRIHSNLLCAGSSTVAKPRSRAVSTTSEGYAGPTIDNEIPSSVRACAILNIITSPPPMSPLFVARATLFSFTIPLLFSEPSNRFSQFCRDTISLASAVSSPCVI